MAYYMKTMTVKDMETILQKTKTVLIPVSVVEQHGYHLPLSVDLFNAVKPIEFAGERLNAVVAPTIHYCFSGGELPGTINVSPQVFALYLMDICREFARLGFVNIVAVLGHGGTENLQEMKMALSMLLRQNKQLAHVNIALLPIFDLSATWQAAWAPELEEKDFHAGMIETSAMMYWAPELVHMENLELDEPETLRMLRSDQDWFEKQEKNIDSPYIIAHKSQKEEVKVGVMGFPEKASAELGKKICEEMTEGLIEFVDYLNQNA